MSKLPKELRIILLSLLDRLNVSDGDASGYEIDKAIVITLTIASAAPTTGNSYLTIDWLQKANATN